MFPIRDHNPSERTPYVTYLLMAANILVYLMTYEAMQSEAQTIELLENWSLVPRFMAEGGSWHPVVTSLFMHAGFMHLAGNMLFLWIFGDNMEDFFGHFGFLVFYMVCGIAASLTHYYSDPVSLVPTVGASGAIAGVLGGYLLLFPRARIDVIFFFIVFFKIFPVRAWVMLAIWFGLQLINSSIVDPDTGGVAYWAHIGGFVAGFVLTIPFWLRRGGPSFWGQSQGQPPHPAAEYELTRTSIPVVRRRRR